MPDSSRIGSPTPGSRCWRTDRGSYPDVARFNETFAAWGFGNAIPPWPENAGLTAEQWSAPGFFIQSGRHDPEIVFARHDYAYDETQAGWFPVLGILRRISCR